MKELSNTLGGYDPSKTFYLLINRSTGAVEKSYDPTDSGIVQAMADGRKFVDTHVLVDSNGRAVNLHAHGGYANVPKWNKGKKD